MPSAKESRSTECTHFNHVIFAEAIRCGFDAKRSKRPKFTLNSWAKKLGLKNSGMLVNILKGDRRPSAKLAKRIIASISRSPEQTEYLELLALRARTDDSDSIAVEAIELKLEALRALSVTRYLNAEEIKLLTDPTTLALRELFLLERVQARTRTASKTEEARVLASFFINPPVIASIQEKLDQLLRLGLLVRNRKGKLILGARHVEGPNRISSEALDLYNEACLDFARSMVRSPALNQGTLRTMFLPFPKKRSAEASQFILEFSRQFAARFCQVSDCDSVYQFGFQLVPWT